MQFFTKKTWTLDCETWNFSWRQNRSIPKKTSQNNFFHSLALHCENAIWNMKIFAFLNALHQISEVSFRWQCSTCPSIWVTFFRQPAWIETDSIVNPLSAVGCVQLVPKYTSKVKLDRGQSPISLSEITIPGENGCCGGNLAWISYFHFY